MDVAEPTSIEDLLTSDDNYQVLIAHPYRSQPFSQSIPEHGWRGKHLVLAVGPEGGFSDQEIELARQRHGRFVSLGPRILRVETAAVALASAIIYAYPP